MSGLCRDCKWWNHDELWPLSADEEKRSWGKCELADNDYGEPMHKNSKAVAVDGENYEARLTTAPDFGCVQFEAREGVDGSR